MTILVIDDDDDVRMVVRMSLTHFGGMTVFEASNGADGVGQAVAQQPDVILLDVMMPGMDGPATLEALRACPETSAIPVIFLTAKVLRTEVDRLRGLGAIEVVQKPFDPATLAEQVRTILQSTP